MRHDPQRVLGKNVEIAHLPLVATKGTSREWQTYRGVEMGVQTLFPFLKAVTEDSNLTIFLRSSSSYRRFLLDTKERQSQVKIFLMLFLKY